MTKEEVLFIMNNLYVGCKVLYSDFIFGPYSFSLKSGTIVDIARHKPDLHEDPICKDCIGYIKIKRDNGSISPFECIVGKDDEKYGFKIKEIIMDDFLKKEEFEI